MPLEEIPAGGWEDAPERLGGPTSIGPRGLGLKQLLPLECQGRGGPAHTLISDFWFPELGENPSVVLSTPHPVCGRLLWQPQDIYPGIRDLSGEVFGRR